MSNSDSTHQSLLQCENRKWNRQEEDFLLGDCITSSCVLLSPVKKELTILKHCTVSSQGALTDLIWILGCWLLGDMMPRTATAHDEVNGGENSKKRKRTGIMLMLNANTIRPSLCLLSHIFRYPLFLCHFPSLGDQRWTEW